MLRNRRVNFINVNNNIMQKEALLPTHEEYLKAMLKLTQEGIFIRENYEKLTDFELAQLAATMSSDLVKIVFGWHNNPTVDGQEIEPFRLRRNV
jgi:hypothetical protein